MVRIRLLIGLIAAFAAGCSTSPVTLDFPAPAAGRSGSYSPLPALREKIDQLLPDSLFPPSQAALLVVSLRTGETLYDLNSALTLTPASNQKLLTSAAALTVLGPSYQFTTSACIDTGLTPRIFISASGDPLLSAGDIDSLARAIARRLPAGRQWNIVGDVSIFDDLEKGRGWAWDDEPDPTAMPVSALSANGNTITVRALTGPRENDTLRVEAMPPTSYVSWNNQAITTDSSVSTLRITRDWRERGNTILLTGALSRRDSVREETLGLAGGEWYALTLFKESLERQGIACGGLALDTLPRFLPAAAGIAHGLDSVVEYMNRVSDNLSAECLLKTLAVSRFGKPGTAASGANVVMQFLSTHAVDTAKIVIADGSGVSRYNLVSPRALVRILAAMDARRDLRDLWHSSLPLAGRHGSLSGRMKETPAAGNLAAKTGTLEGVSTLSGYVTTADGEPLAFSFMMEHFPARSRVYRQVQDRIGAFLAGLNLAHLRR
jgi:serine-type D-Ala-D-Ala carboxypeptidase/endopeptidase (penicillin-binding protein 4)